MIFSQRTFSQDGQCFLIKCNMVCYPMYLPHTCSPTYLPSQLLTYYSPTHSPTYYLPTYYFTFVQPTYLPTHLHTTYLPTYLPTHPLIYLSLTSMCNLQVWVHLHKSYISEKGKTLGKTYGINIELLTCDKNANCVLTLGLPKL